MDLFTHVIFAYLLSFIIWGPAAPQYIAAGALGRLPDADILLYPLTRWFPSLHHRGAVHTIVGVTIIAAVGSLLVPYLPYFTHASTLLYFVAMEIGGLSHLVLDGFTNYAVRPLLPFSGRSLRLNAGCGRQPRDDGRHGGDARGAHQRARNGAVQRLDGDRLDPGRRLRRLPAPPWARPVEGRRPAGSVRLPSRSSRAPCPGNGSCSRKPILPNATTFGSADLPRFGLTGSDRTLDVVKRPPTTGPVASPETRSNEHIWPPWPRASGSPKATTSARPIEKGGVYEVWWYIVDPSRPPRAYGSTARSATGTMQLKSGFLQHPTVGPM